MELRQAIAPNAEQIINYPCQIQSKHFKFSTNVREALQLTTGTALFPCFCNLLLSIISITPISSNRVAPLIW